MSDRERLRVHVLGRFRLFTLETPIEDQKGRCA
jgi:hypothetical protein